MDVENMSKCPKCEKNESEDEHPCPYKIELFDDEESLCDCCMECRFNCAMDV